MTWSPSNPDPGARTLSGMQQGASRGRPRPTSHAEGAGGRGDGVEWGRCQEGEKHFSVRWEKKMEACEIRMERRPEKWRELLPEFSVFTQ